MYKGRWEDKDSRQTIKTRRQTDRQDEMGNKITDISKESGCETERELSHKKSFVDAFNMPSLKGIRPWLKLAGYYSVDRLIY